MIRYICDLCGREVEEKVYFSSFYAEIQCNKFHCDSCYKKYSKIRDKILDSAYKTLKIEYKKFVKEHKKGKKK